MPSFVSVLFVCSRNKWRSPTAEKVFSNYPNLQVRSAGLSPQSPRELSLADLSWADIVFVMEHYQKKRILDAFRDSDIVLPENIVINIPDEYHYMQPELISLLEMAVPSYASRLAHGRA